MSKHGHSLYTNFGIGWGHSRIMIPLSPRGAPSFICSGGVEPCNSALLHLEEGRSGVQESPWVGGSFPPAAAAFPCSAQPAALHARSLALPLTPPLPSHSRYGKPSSTTPASLFQGSAWVSSQKGEAGGSIHSLDWQQRFTNSPALLCRGREEVTSSSCGLLGFPLAC